MSLLEFRFKKKQKTDSNKQRPPIFLITEYFHLTNFFP